MVSVDSSGMLEYWTGPRHEYQFPRTVSWQYKTDTDFYEFAKVKIGYRWSSCGSVVIRPHRMHSVDAAYCSMCCGVVCLSVGNVCDSCENS